MIDQSHLDLGSQQKKKEELTYETILTNPHTGLQKRYKSQI